MSFKKEWKARILIGFLLCFAPLAVFGAAPVVKTVPWVVSNPTIPHDAYVGKIITLKGTSDVEGPAGVYSYSWDFGDGSPNATGSVVDFYPGGTERRSWAIDAQHAYSGIVGTVYTARLTVTRIATAETSSKAYFVQLRADNQGVDVNIAIDEGLWYLHKTMHRYDSGGLAFGDWQSCPDVGVSCYAESGWGAVNAANVQAFFVNGHREDGSVDNPYTETVTRGMRRVFEFLDTSQIDDQSNPLLPGGFSPDRDKATDKLPFPGTAGNGYGVYASQGNYIYQSGMFMDAIIAAGQPDKLTTTGPTASGSNPGIQGRKYGDIAKDMADFLLYCQYDFAPEGGSWRYGCNDYVDNSPSQWAAIGLIPTERVLGYKTPDLVKQWNLTWIDYSHHPDGYYGYVDQNPIWGPFAVTPSAMVQMAWDGVGRGDSRWDTAETYLRENFANPESYGSYGSIKAYYYGLFSMTKALMLHDNNADGVADPITLMRSSVPGTNLLDWYGAEQSALPEDVNNTNGVARTLINDQDPGGFWYYHNDNTSETWAFDTAWSIIMLNRTLFETGAPVAVISATPNPAVAFQTINLNGGGSFHQDPLKTIVKWEWDLDNNGTFEVNGVTTTASFTAVGTYPIRLRVTDNTGVGATGVSTVNLVVSVPPLAPTANAGGPYNFCAAKTPWFLDGSASSNPDNGQHQPGAFPGDFIKSYLWDLDGGGFGGAHDASGVAPNVTAQFSFLGVGSYNVTLKVTDNTSLSYPASGQPDLTGVASSIVNVLSNTDLLCRCTDNLTVRAKSTTSELFWTPRTGVPLHHYNIYRGTVLGGPKTKVGTVTASAGYFADSGLTANTTYYYEVREAQANGSESCTSNQITVKTGR